MSTQVRDAAVGAPAARRGWAKLRQVLYPLAVLAGILAALEAVLRLASVPTYVLPTPSAVGAALFENRQLLLKHTTVTAVEALLGFFAGNALGVLLAVLFVYSRTMERALFPVAQTVRSIPVVALAPLFLLWFGNGMTPKVLTAALISFFPTLVNVFRGLSSVDRSSLELMYTLAATPSQVFWKLRWPAALPYLFSALKIASASAVIGALVAEWVGSDTGLGYLVITSTYEFRVELLWATIAVTSLLAIALYEIVDFFEKRVIPWHESVGSPE